MLMRRSNFFDLMDEMSKCQRDMNPFFVRTGSSSEVADFPPLKVYNDGEFYVVKAEIPGIDPKDLEIEATADSLTIKGKQKKPTSKEGESFQWGEKEWGTFNRSITLGTKVNPDKIKAEYKLGILKVILPKADRLKPKKIEILA